MKKTWRDWVTGAFIMETATIIGIALTLVVIIVVATSSCQPRKEESSLQGEAADISMVIWEVEPITVIPGCGLFVDIYGNYWGNRKKHIYGILAHSGKPIDQHAIIIGTTYKITVIPIKVYGRWYNYLKLQPRRIPE